MFDIVHDLTIRAPTATVFDCVSTPNGLDAWWTLTCAGELALGRVFTLGFGDDCVWTAVVDDLAPGERFALRMTDAADDWIDTRVQFEIEKADGGALLRFAHAGWTNQSAHFRRTSYCWAVYLRLMRIYCETGSKTPYSERYFG